MRYRRPESVLVIVATADEVLLLRRREPPDYWQSVTGSLEWGESPLDAARRELREETGLPATGLEETDLVSDFEIVPPWTGKFAPGTRSNREYVYLLQLRERPDIELDGREHVEHGWFALAEAVALASSATNRDAIRHLLKG